MVIFHKKQDSFPVSTSSGNPLVEKRRGDLYMHKKLWGRRTLLPAHAAPPISQAFTEKMNIPVSWE